MSKRPPKGRKPNLRVCSNLRVHNEIHGWELELLLSVVGNLLDDELEEVGDDEQEGDQTAAKLK